jgi:hypothetical protein
MSRRFGRNQRRKLREKVAASEDQLNAALAQARLSSYNAARARQELDDIKRDFDYARSILGHYHVALPPQTIALQSVDEPYTRIPCGAGKTPVFKPLNMQIDIRDMSMSIADCANLVAKYGESNVDRSVHAYVQSRNGSWGYAMPPRHSLMPNQIRDFCLRASSDLCHRIACDLEQFYKTGNPPQ